MADNLHIAVAAAAVAAALASAAVSIASAAAAADSAAAAKAAVNAANPAAPRPHWSFPFVGKAIALVGGATLFYGLYRGSTAMSECLASGRKLADDIDAILLNNQEAARVKLTETLDDAVEAWKAARCPLFRVKLF